MITALPSWWFNATAKTQRPAVTQDSGGGVIQTYSDNLTGLSVRFNVDSGGQQSSSERINGVRNFKVYVSGAPDITDNDILVYNGRKFDINATRNVDELGVYTILDVVEVSPA